MKKVLSVLLCLVLCIGPCAPAVLASSEMPSTPAPGEPLEGPSASNDLVEDSQTTSVYTEMEPTETVEAVEVVEIASAASIDVLTVIALCVSVAAVILAVTAAVLVVKTKKCG